MLYEERYGDQYGSARRVLTRFDARRATRLSRTRYDCALGFTEQHCPAGTDYREVAMAATGAGAVEVTDLATGTMALRGFGPSGVFATLAMGSVDGLRLTRSGVTWTQAGVAQSAPLPG
ncbi:MAG: hypothetical protein QOG94_1117 [Solirubrobacteraceae bacterium]|nr:hypothetical protein [Solirubrobacteraceae bacterium]